MLFSARTRRLAMLAVPLAVSAFHAMASTPTLDRIRETGTIRLAYREDSVPFSYTDGGKPIGYSIDICSRVVDAIRTSLKRPELKVQYLPVTAANRMDTIASGKADLECG
ncbi:transporter substrate-binding domain-containing protein, partial [Ralstonia pseudosolanacearum]